MKMQMTAIQFNRTLRLAGAHGHLWACWPDAATDDDVPTIDAIRERSGEHQHPGLPGGIYAPGVDKYGDVVHTTATGRLEWFVDRAGKVELRVLRPHPAIRDGHGGKRRPEELPYSAVAEHLPWAIAQLRDALVKGHSTPWSATETTGWGYQHVDDRIDPVSLVHWALDAHSPTVVAFAEIEPGARIPLDDDDDLCVAIHDGCEDRHRETLIAAVAAIDPALGREAAFLVAQRRFPDVSRDSEQVEALWRASVGNRYDEPIAA